MSHVCARIHTTDEYSLSFFIHITHVQTLAHSHPFPFAYPHANTHTTRTHTHGVILFIFCFVHHSFSTFHIVLRTVKSMWSWYCKRAFMRLTFRWRPCAAASSKLTYHTHTFKVPIQSQCDNHSCAFAHILTIRLCLLPHPHMRHLSYNGGRAQRPQVSSHIIHTHSRCQITMVRSIHAYFHIYRPLDRVCYPTYTRGTYLIFEAVRSGLKLAHHIHAYNLPFFFLLFFLLRIDPLRFIYFKVNGAT